ncbi:hypothetical protein MRX96_005223 [Rhipicephalus microplus]
MHAMPKKKKKSGHPPGLAQQQNRAVRPQLSTGAFACVEKVSKAPAIVKTITKPLMTDDASEDTLMHPGVGPRPRWQLLNAPDKWVARPSLWQVERALT